VCRIFAYHQPRHLFFFWDCICNSKFKNCAKNVLKLKENNNQHIKATFLLIFLLFLCSEEKCCILQFQELQSQSYPSHTLSGIILITTSWTESNYCVAFETHLQLSIQHSCIMNSHSHRPYSTSPFLFLPPFSLSFFFLLLLSHYLYLLSFQPILFITLTWLNFYIYPIRSNITYNSWPNESLEGKIQNNKAQIQYILYIAQVDGMLLLWQKWGQHVTIFSFFFS